MNITDIITLVGAIATFLFGMSTMTDGLEKLSSGRLESILERLTSNVVKGVLLGALVTGLIQSSAATTVMCVGFVNAGIMRLEQTVGIIMGANIGTTVTAQLLRLGDLSSDNLFLAMLNPSVLGPLLAAIGVVFYMFIRGGKKRIIGQIILGLGLLFIGMKTMEGAVSGLQELPEFQALFSAFSNPLLGILVGGFTGLHIDGWVGILVAVFILRAGWGAAKDTLDPLLGQSPDPTLVHAIEKTVLAHEIVTGIHDLIIHDYGPGRSMLSLHAEVPMDADMLAVHDVIDDIERELKEKFHIEAVIHMDPIATKDPLTNELKAKVAGLVQQIDPAMTIHDFRMTQGPHHQNLIFDVVVPHSSDLTDEEVKSRIAGRMGELPGGPYFAVVSVDRSYAE